MKTKRCYEKTIQLSSNKKVEYTKAQRMYMKLCNNSKVRPDTEFVNHLPDQILYFPNLDNARRNRYSWCIDQSYDRKQTH